MRPGGVDCAVKFRRVSSDRTSPEVTICDVRILRPRWPAVHRHHRTARPALCAEVAGRTRPMQRGRLAPGRRHRAGTTRPAEPDHGPVRADFRGLRGESVLVWTRNCLAERGHQLVITGSQPLVRRLLALTGLVTYLGL